MEVAVSPKRAKERKVPQDADFFKKQAMQLKAYADSFRKIGDELAERGSSLSVEGLKNLEKAKADIKRFVNKAGGDLPE